MFVKLSGTNELLATRYLTDGSSMPSKLLKFFAVIAKSVVAEMHRVKTAGNFFIIAREHSVFAVRRHSSKRSRAGIVPRVTTLLIATRNAHKVGEMRAILGERFQFLTLDDFPNAPK